VLYSTFSQQTGNAIKEPIFLGNPVNVSRYDLQKYSSFEKLIEKQLSFFWRPEEVDISKDRIDFNSLPEHEKHIFISNLKYQTLLDSVQGRSPNVAFLPLVSLPEVETWLETWAFSETIHSRSYTHIIRNILPDASVVFDSITTTPEIINRAESVTKYYDDLIEMTSYYNLLGEGRHIINGNPVDITIKSLKKAILLCLISVNALEGIRFYVSFACSFAFAERSKMEGNAKIIKLIARDEALHMQGTQVLLNLLISGRDDPEFAEIARESRDECIEIFKQCAEQEQEWADYLFKDGSIIGLNAEILKNYVKYISNIRMSSLNFDPLYPDVNGNPLPWMSPWLQSDNTQVAPQESEISSYLVGQIDNEVGDTDFDDFDI
jgi:ribonucleoside-diphosphate reductase beta chain